MSTDTPTPRAVLRPIAEKYALYVSGMAENWERYLDVAQETYALVTAALAASAGPLTAEQVTEWARLRERIESELSPSAKRCLNEWIGGLDTACTALTADLAALRATVAELKDLALGLDNCAECGKWRRCEKHYRALEQLARTPTPEGQG